MQKINFQNLPNTNTPLNATNMNQLQTNVENAINDSLINKSLASATNYKNITEPGIYSVAGSQVTNCPYSSGVLVVFLRTGSSTYRFYIYIRYDGLMYISTYWDGTWYDWTRVSP